MRDQHDAKILTRRLLKSGMRRLERGVTRRVRHAIGETNVHWARVVMDRETERFVRSLDYRSMHALEISGSKWKDFGFASYQCAEYPNYDVCERPLERDAFDLVIAEQVLEHVLWPYRAVRNVCAMLKAGGVFLVTAPFLLMVHECPVDCSRWTPLGLKHLLAEGGFSLEKTLAGSWGNRACVRSNFKPWTLWMPGLHSLKDEPDFPVVVWAFARK